MVRVYMDGVFDLFHIGHLEAIKKCKEFGDIIIIGVISDLDASSYKRNPIINEIDRVKIISALKLVDKVIFPAPLILNEDFIINNNIDLVVHGFSNPNDYNTQKEFFRVPINMGIFRQIDYYPKISTTDIITTIKNNF